MQFESNVYLMDVNLLFAKSEKCVSRERKSQDSPHNSTRQSPYMPGQDVEQQ